ncbi:transposase [Spirochaetia bacterium]|nr:transposase [Spirochaetia bacterium]
MNELMLITVYCIVDDFINMLMNYPIGQELMRHWQGKRGPKRRLCLAEVITLNILRFYYRVYDLKIFHRLARNTYTAAFPGLPNYENFLKATNKSFPVLLMLLKYLLAVNRGMEAGGPFFMDSTALPVCDNHYIASHRVAKGFASRGKTTKGWFFGFKAHGVCDAEGTLLNLCFTSGSVHDSQVVSAVTEGLEGVFVGDAGYLLQAESFQALYEKHRHIMSAARKNMKRLMSGEQKQLFRSRNIIETTWDVLKERFQLVCHLARSMTGLFRHYVYSFVSFLFRPVLESDPLLLTAPLLL